jgi:hypothetical protein
MVVKIGSVWGATIGALLLLSAFSASAVIAPFLLAITICQVTLNNLRLYVFILWASITVWILAKSWSIGGIGAYLLQDLFLISVVAAFSILTYRKIVLQGMILALVPIVFFDATSNILQLTIGVDFLGNTPDLYRSDGVRLVGLFEHSFVSLGLYFSFFLLVQAVGQRKPFVYAPIVMMILVGTFRSYIFPPILLVYAILFRMTWRIVFFTSLAIAVAVFVATFLSINWGFLSESSGNAFRVIAWLNAFVEISRHPVTGIEVAPPPFPEDFSATEDNFVKYQIYESMLLQDAVRYGLPLVFMKLLFFYHIGKIHYKKCAPKSEPLASAKNIIVAFLITDYVAFSYFGMPITALVAGSILGSRNPKA